MSHLFRTVLAATCLGAIATGVLANGTGSRAQIYEFGLFKGHGAPIALRASKSAKRTARLPNFDVASGKTGQLLTLIAFAEAGPAGYDAVHYAARRMPRARPTTLSIEEIFDWIAATPGQNHAIGRYQFIPATLRRLVRAAQLPAGARFTPEVQDHLATILLEEAGLSKFRSGAMARDTFMDRLALIWAGLPTRNGLSAYNGYAGNSATITRTEFEAGLAAIFP